MNFFLKYLTFIIIFLNFICILAVSPLGSIAFETDEEAIANGWVIDNNNEFNIPDEIVILKKNFDNGNGIVSKWVYARSMGQSRIFRNICYWRISSSNSGINSVLQSSNNIGKKV